MCYKFFWQLCARGEPSLRTSSHAHAVHAVCSNKCLAPPARAANRVCVKTRTRSNRGHVRLATPCDSSMASAQSQYLTCSRIDTPTPLPRVQVGAPVHPEVRLQWGIGGCFFVIRVLAVYADWQIRSAIG